VGEFRHAEPYLLAHATAKGPIQNFTGGLAQMLAEKGIRVDAVAPGPIWTPLIPSTMPEDAVKSFGKRFPIKRPGPPAESATTYVVLGAPLSSFTSGTTVAVTGKAVHLRFDGAQKQRLKEPRLLADVRYNQ